MNIEFSSYHKLGVPGVGKSKILIDRSGVHVIPLQLPRDITCDHCVIQWKFHTGM